jgi:hypothetical protein
MLMPHRELVDVEDPKLILLTDLPAHPSLEHCFTCKQTAVYLICGKIPPPGIDLDNFEPALAEIVDMVREQFGSNFEIPVCETHAGGVLGVS